MTAEQIQPFSIGNKFPITISSSQELDKWLSVNIMPRTFSLQYNGIMEDSTLYKICNCHELINQVVYDISDICTSNDKFLRYGRQIFRQVLFINTYNIKIPLIYNRALTIERETKILIDLFNYWLNFKWYADREYGSQSLYRFCRDFNTITYNKYNKNNLPISLEEIRDAFQFIRAKDYELFKMFYIPNKAIYQGGKIIDVE